MRRFTPFHALGAAAAISLLAGCSGSSAIAPHMSTQQGHAKSMMGRIPLVASPLSLLKVNRNPGNHFKSFLACPAAGPIVYFSDFNNSTVSVFTLPLAGQAPCGMLTSANGLINPQGMMVKAGDLYVANTGAGDILAFHRGSTTAFKTYTDTINGSQFPVDVTVSADNTVIASNIFGANEAGSLSTFNKTSGATIGNFPNSNGANTYFLTVQHDGTVYYDDNTFSIYVGSCPAGACGSFVGTGATMDFPGGLRSADGEDVIFQDQSAPAGSGTGTANEYEAFPSTFTSCPLNGVDPVSFDINRPQHHYFFADAGLNEGVEVSWTAGTTSCPLIGTVPGNTSGLPIGAAKDLPEHLN